MKNTAKRMRGASFSQTLIFVSLLVLFLYMGVRLIPNYVDNYQIKEALQEVAKQAATKNLSKAEITDLFMRQLQVNDIRGMDPKNLISDRQKNKFIINYDYESRVHLVGNIDAVLVFKNRVESE